MKILIATDFSPEATEAARVATAIRREVVVHAADLVVVGACGARGKSSFRDYAETLALTLPCPVLVVWPVSGRMRFALANKRHLRVFVAADRSDASSRAIAWVRSLRQKLPCDVIVGHYYDPGVEHARLGVGLTAVDLLGTARVANADLIVVGTHRRSKLSRFFQGSVARDVVRHSDVPVACIGEPGDTSSAVAVQQ